MFTVCLNNKDFNSFDQTTVPVVAFLDYFVLSLSSCGSAYDDGTNVNESRSGLQYWTRIHSFGSFLCVKKHEIRTHTSLARNAGLVLKAGSVV